jgi:hypothetical protein
MPDRSRCPNCRERVSPYAAGCAICGADLDTRRWDSGPGALNGAGSFLAAVSFGAGYRLPLAVFVAVLLFGGSWLAGLFG